MFLVIDKKEVSVVKKADVLMNSTDTDTDVPLKTQCQEDPLKKVYADQDVHMSVVNSGDP